MNKIQFKIGLLLIYKKIEIGEEQFKVIFNLIAKK